MAASRQLRDRESELLPAAAHDGARFAAGARGRRGGDGLRQLGQRGPQVREILVDQAVYLAK